MESRTYVSLFSDMVQKPPISDGIEVDAARACPDSAEGGYCASPAHRTASVEHQHAMKARDVMNSAVVAVRPDTPINDIAKTLREHRISAVPVIDEAGSPLGMVSEGDLIGRDEADREARLDWWLTLLAEGEALNPEFLASIHAPERRARDLMTAPVIAVGEETEIEEVARLLTAHRIKRVPVLRGDRIVGIVSRADLVRALAESKMRPTG